MQACNRPLKLQAWVGHFHRTGKLALHGRQFEKDAEGIVRGALAALAEVALYKQSLDLMPPVIADRGADGTVGARVLHPVRFAGFQQVLPHPLFPGPGGVVVDDFGLPSGVYTQIVRGTPRLFE